tara:strand:+ start:226 stop:858 length:633 start_codon:yes stop_codon:yes gene_type:complete
MNEIIRLDNVSIDSSGRNLLNTSLRINKGDFVLIYGDNAVGKSLLLKLLYLKILPSRGNIYLFKKKISSESKEKIIEYRKKLGVILQSDFLIPFFTVFQNIEIASEIQNKKYEFKKRMTEILDWLDLAKIRNVLVGKLSDGQKQKVVIARALINNPSIIIADQPENYLDDETTKKLFFLLESLNKLGATIVMTSNKNHNIKNDHRVVKLI